MNRIKKLKDKPVNTSRVRLLQFVADNKPLLIRKPLIKVDKGGRLSIRDKAIRKIMPKAMDLIGSRKEKDMLLNRLLDMVEKAQKMGPKATLLHSQLWVVYAAIEAAHVDDDHWEKTDLPQPWSKPKSLTAVNIGKTVYLLERELVAVAATDWHGESGDDTHGYQFTGGILDGSDRCDNLDGFWSAARAKGKEPELWRNEYQLTDVALPNKSEIVGPRLPASLCKATASPLPTSKPWSDLTWNREIDLLPRGYGSGLPFEPATKKLDSDHEIDKAFRYGISEVHPLAKEPVNTDEAIADNLKWLKSRTS